MRVLRLVFGLALVAMVVAVWQRRTPIVEAYTEERAPVEFEFDGLDFELARRTDLGPSPLQVPRAPDTGAVALAVSSVAGPEENTSPILPSGDVVFTGQVTDELGPVPLAVVRLEHHLVPPSGGVPVVATIDLVADQDGRWELADVGGGRWRARAFVPEQRASAEPTVRFVEAGASVVLDLRVVQPPAQLVLDLTSPSSLVPNEAAMVAVGVGRRRVDAEGIVIIDPVPGVSVDITLAGSPLQLLSSPTSVTDTTGIARFGIACLDLGPTSASFVVAAGTDDTTSLTSALSECVALPPPPANDPSADTTTTTFTDGGSADD